MINFAFAQNNCECEICKIPCNSPLSAHNNPSCPAYKSYHNSNSEGGRYTSASGPTEKELKAFYDGQWANNLKEDAMHQFNKGMKAYNKGDCKEAAKLFKKAKLFADDGLFNKYLKIAEECINSQQLAKNPTPPTFPTSYTSTVKPNPPVTSNNTNSSKPTSPSDIAAKIEEKKMVANTKTWIEYQKEQFKLRIDSPNRWCKQYINELQRLIDANNKEEKWNPLKPKSIKDLLPGDVILVEGTDIAGNLIKAADWAFTGSTSSNASHTLTCIREINGKKYFLDNNPSIGAIIISEDQFKEKYDGRGTEIARMVGDPINSQQAKQLWDKAIELQAKNNNAVIFQYRDGNDLKKIGGTEYGVFGDDMVCSKASWELLKATGRKVPLSKGWFNGWLKKYTIGFSPADFYENHQYFLITPLDITK